MVRRMQKRTPLKRTPLKRKPSVFELSKGLSRHPLDRPFGCGFDPLNVTIKQYRVHISNCLHKACIERHRRWLDLMEYFR